MQTKIVDLPRSCACTRSEAEVGINNVHTAAGMRWVGYVHRTLQTAGATVQNARSDLKRQAPEASLHPGLHSGTGRLCAASKRYAQYRLQRRCEGHGTSCPALGLSLWPPRQRRQSYCSDHSWLAQRPLCERRSGLRHRASFQAVGLSEVLRLGASARARGVQAQGQYVKYNEVVLHEAEKMNILEPSPTQSGHAEKC